MNWSKFQLEIFSAVSRGTDSLLVNAVAGSGKTTTIIEAISHVPSNQKVAFLAFNKAIADTLRTRVTAPNARCMTLHSAGNASWRTMLAWDSNGCMLDSRKTSGLISRLLSWQDRTKFGGTIGKLVGFAKGAGLVPRGSEGVGLVPDTDESWEEMIEFYGLEEEECSIPLSRRVLAESIQVSREVIDFDDMLFMPVVTQCPFEQYDVVFLDEAQDVNSLQVEMVRRMVRPGGRVIAVGDPHQAIYGFRGALSDSMAHIGEEFRCQDLPLSISYRCPKAVVAHAKQWVPHIESHETAEEGLVETLVPLPPGPEYETEGFWEIRDFLPSDAILCRINRPLVVLAFRLIRARIACRIAGRDIGKGLVDLVNKMKAENIPDLCRRLEKYREREIARARGNESKITSVHDRIDTLYVFIDALGPDAGSDELIHSIEGLFTDNNFGLLTLSTIHKAKGLEWDRVFILDADQFMPIPWAREGWARQQEDNLCYVAATRARKELRYLMSEGIR